MQYHFIRFDQTDGVRRFAFDCVADDRSVSHVVVRADVTLARKYDIRLQELPLLCRRFLSELPADRQAAAVTFSETDMRAVRTAAEAIVETRKQKTSRVSATTGHAWRHPQL